MREIENWEQIDENGEFKKLPASIQKVKITDVVDIPDKEYLEVYFDIVDGEFKGYFGAIKETTGKDYSKTIRSYKTNALKFFKSFITAVEKTNKDYKWNWNEKSLIGKYVVAVFGEEEYVKDGELQVAVKCDLFRSVEALNKGEIKIPERKKLTDEQRALLNTSAPVYEAVDVNDPDYPF